MYMMFIYLQLFIHHFTGLFGTNIMTSSQLVEHSTSIAEVMGLNPVLNFFLGLSFTTVQVGFITAKIAFILNSQVLKLRFSVLCF